MMKCIEAGDTVVYRLKKGKGPLLFMVIFFPIWLYFAGFFLIPYIRYLDSGAPEMHLDYMISGLVVFAVAIPIVLIILFSYTLNDLVITDRHVYIRKGISGKTQILQIGDIRSFQHVYAGKNKSNHRIYFYLLCGKIVKTGNLYITLGSLLELLEHLRGRFEGRGFTANEMEMLAEQYPHAGRPELRTNYAVLALMLTPVILALCVVAVYFTRL